MGMCENCNGTDYDILRELSGNIFVKLLVVKYEGFLFYTQTYSVSWVNTVAEVELVDVYFTKVSH